MQEYLFLLNYKLQQDEEYISQILQDAVNPIIDIVKQNLEQSGYTLPIFDSLYNS